MKSTYAQELFDFWPFGRPGLPGVYMVCTQLARRNSPHVLYIGSSGNVRRRLNKPSHPYHAAYSRLASASILVYVKIWCTENYIEEEARCIREYCPPLNRQLVGG